MMGHSCDALHFLHFYIPQVKSDSESVSFLFQKHEDQGPML